VVVSGKFAAKVVLTPVGTFKAPALAGLPVGLVVVGVAVSPQAANNTLRDSRATTKEFHLERCLNIQKILPLPEPENPGCGSVFAGSSKF
jgi:hypothetical protein